MSQNREHTIHDHVPLRAVLSSSSPSMVHLKDFLHRFPLCQSSTHKSTNETSLPSQQRHSTIQDMAKCRYNLIRDDSDERPRFNWSRGLSRSRLWRTVTWLIDANNRKNRFLHSLICVYISIVRWTASPEQHTSSGDLGWHPPALSPEATSWRTGDSGSGMLHRTIALRLFYLL